MVKTPPTIEALKEVGKRLIESGKQQLKATKDLLPVIKLGDAGDGTADMVIGLGGDTPNSEAAKEKVADFIKQQIAKHGFFHSVFMFDTYRLVSKDAAEGEMILGLRRMGVPSPDIARMGLGKLREQISVVIEAVGTKIGMSCPYERDADGNVTSFGEIEEVADAKYEGRFIFFPAPKGEAN